jgi:hypothetical protein
MELISLLGSSSTSLTNTTAIPVHVSAVAAAPLQALAVSFRRRSQLCSIYVSCPRRFVSPGRTFQYRELQLGNAFQ